MQKIKRLFDKSWIHQPFKGFEQELRQELGKTLRLEKSGLFIADAPLSHVQEDTQHTPHIQGNPLQTPVWAQNTWFNPAPVFIESIGHAVKTLKGLQRNWHFVDITPQLSHGRVKLIQEQLPKIRFKPHEYGNLLPKAPLGTWCLWTRDCIVAATHCSSPFPSGNIEFVEDKVNPPNRAYLKLWEVFTRLEIFPQKGDLCFDLGSSPGGWTWVLAQLGCSVISVDKAPLAKEIDILPNVTYCQNSVFAFDPRMVGKLDWLFSDVICYPERLYEMILRWLELGQCRNFICTIKLQGDDIPEVLEKFKAIPQAQFIHLCHNKHEITFVLLENQKM